MNWAFLHVVWRKSRVKTLLTCYNSIIPMFWLNSGSRDTYGNANQTCWIVSSNSLQVLQLSLSTLVLTKSKLFSCMLTRKNYPFRIHAGSLWKCPFINPTKLWKRSLTQHSLSAPKVSALLDIYDISVCSIIVVLSVLLLWEDNP
jgi:hypothetical protein